MNTNDDDSDDIISNINMTPLIDIMLVLLILFMVTSTVSFNSGLDIDLPQHGNKEEKEIPSGVIVSLNKNGKIYINNKIINLNDLKGEIAVALSKVKTKLIIFEGDKSALLGQMVQIMGIAKSAGAKNFAIATDED